MYCTIHSTYYGSFRDIRLTTGNDRDSSRGHTTLDSTMYYVCSSTKPAGLLDRDLLCTLGSTQIICVEETMEELEKSHRSPLFVDFPS